MRSRISFAIFDLLVEGIFFSTPSALIRVTSFLSDENPISDFETSLATIQSKFFSLSFLFADDIMLLVSAAKPTNTWFFFLLPNIFKMSGFLFKIIFFGNSFFRSFLSYIFDGR